MKKTFFSITGVVSLLVLNPCGVFGQTGKFMDESLKTALEQAYEKYTQGQFQKALESEEIAYQRTLEHYGPNHPSLASVLEDLAEMRRNLGQYGEAERNLKWCIALREQAINGDDPKLADTLEKLVDLYQDMGRYGDAFYLETRAANIRRKAKDFKGEGNLLGRFGLFEMELSDLSKAQNDLSQAISLLGKNGGNANLSLVRPLQTRANLYTRLNKWSEAQKDLERVLEIEQTNYTGSGMPTGNAFLALGEFFDLQNKKDKSKPYYQQALKIYIKLLPGNSGYLVLSLMERTAAAYRGLGDYSKALDLDTKALDVEKEVYGATHPRTALCRGRIAWDEELMGDHTKAQTDRRVAKKIIVDTLGEGHPLVRAIENPVP